LKKKLLSTLVLAASAGLVQAGPATPPAAAKDGLAQVKAPSSGIAIEYIEPSVRPQDDFYEHLHGKWLKTTTIPADKPEWGSFAIVREQIRPQLQAIIEKAAAKPGKPAGGAEQLIGDFYRSFMDEARVEQLGLTPLKAEFGRITALKDKSELPALLAHLDRIGVSVPYSTTIHQDARDPTRYVVDIGQSGLGMPDRDYYLKPDDARMADMRAQYRSHVRNMLALAGDENAAADAGAVLDFETALARVQWTRVENRDPVRTYNRVAMADLPAMAPGFGWRAWADAAGISGKTDHVVVSQPSYLTAYAEIADKTPISVWRSYLKVRLLASYAGFLSRAFAEESFAFYGTALVGAPRMEPRWKRGVTVVERALGEAVGKLYVEQYFPAERKARLETMVARLLAAMGHSIDTLDWMSMETRKQASAKLAKFRTKIAYPDRWKDYSKLTVAPDDLVGNVMRARALASDWAIGKLGKPVDRDEWLITPQTVNAYYNPEANEIVFPAAILQPPFFDPDADDAVNYGAIGAFIGHEISHGFDDQGSQYDGDGKLRNWWTPADHANFKARTSMLVSQYGGYSPVPGYTINGELTLGENIGDNSGLAIAYKAWKRSLDGKPAPVIDGLTGEQRFYMGWGQVWRSKIRDAFQVALLKADPHSPRSFRVNGALKNQDGFHEAFGVKPGDRMYLAPTQRVRIW
jgi:predicted metalloendopeptidase